MESGRFDTITKLLALGISRRGAAAGLASLAAARINTLKVAEAKKKRKKKKFPCKKLRQTCANAKNKRCCGSLKCEDVPGCTPDGTYCCADFEESCDNACDCCGAAICDPGSRTCCLPEGSACDSASTCCSGLSCTLFSCQVFP